MNDDGLLLIAHQATYLAERLAGTWIPTQGEEAQQAAQARLERWCHLAAGGDWGRFGGRLAWDGLDLGGARRLLTDGYLAAWTEPPAWTEMLAEALAQASNAPLPPDPALVVQPFLTVAQGRLQHMAGAKLLWLAPVAQERLTAYLHQQLCQAAAPALEFTGWQSLSALCHTYPVLARQLATQAMQWVAACVEFLPRLAADWPLLLAAVGQEIALGPGVITDLQPGLSDRHADGRTVWVVTIGGGRHTETTLAYKPKALTMDRAWNDLLAWCNGQGLAPQLETLWTLPRAGYGWMAWAATQPTAPADQLRYYQRVGMLLGLLHLLQATDCHAENLAPRGDQLLLVDAEMMPYPQIGELAHADPLDVMRTGLLPRWQVSQQGVAELGGITAGRPLSPAERDALVAGYRNLHAFLARHWPELNAATGPLAPFRQGRVRFAPRPTAAYLRLLDYLRHPTFLQRGIDFSIGADQLARSYLTQPHHEGFWPLLAAEHAALNQGDVPYFTVAVGQAKLRNENFITYPSEIERLRDSEIIGCNLSISQSPNCCNAQVIKLPFLSGEMQPMAFALRWPPFTLPTPLAHQQQARLIAASLDCAPYLPVTQRTAARTASLSGANADSFLTWAVHLGDLLIQRAIPLANGGWGWIANQWQPQSRLHQHGLVDDGLYSGRAGIALFLAALYHVTGDEAWRRAALAGFRGCPEEDVACHAAIDEVGGRIYALSHAAALLGAPDLLNAAVTISCRNDDEKQTLTWGVLDGQAGLLLGLLALYHQLTATNHPAAAPLLVRAIACGDALIAGQEAWLDGRRGLGGFSHGVAGIGYALAALATLSNENFIACPSEIERLRDWEIAACNLLISQSPNLCDAQLIKLPFLSSVVRFQTGAEAAWARQEMLYANPPGNWQDRRGAAPVYLDNWCNGAAGIGLAAAGSVQTLPQLATVVERAATLLIENSRGAALDTLCCGRFGQIESLLEMGLILGRPAWVAQAVQFAQEAVTTAATTGHFRLYDDLPAHLFNPTFFRGVAGIGYTLLRLAAATGETTTPLPCVLQWSLRNENLITYHPRLRD